MGHGLETGDGSMIGLGILLVLVILIAVVVYASFRSMQGTEQVRSMADAAPTRLQGSIRRWVDADLIDEEQARAIENFEDLRQPPSTPPRVSPAIEALAYVGGVLLTVGVGMLVGRFWDDMNVVAHLSIVGAVGAGAGIAGRSIGESDPVARRLRGFLWMSSAIAFGALAGLVAYGIFDRRGEPVAFATSMTAAFTSVIFWNLRDRVLQHLVTFISLVVATGVGIAWIASVNPSAWIGIAYWVLGAVWAMAAWRRWIPPDVIGFPLGVALTLIGAGVTGGRYDWLAPLLGLATAAAWTALGIGVNEVLALAPGVLGIFVYLPWTLARFFGESLGAPVIVTLSGLLLLTVVAVLWRRRAHGAQIGDLWGGHFGSTAHL